MRVPVSTSGRTLVVDPTFGIAGDMLMAALVDAGADTRFVRRCVEAVLPDTIELRIDRTIRCGMAAAVFDVRLVDEDQPHRSWHAVRRALEDAQLPTEVRDLALRVFAELAEAEGAVHGVEAEDVHFHEVGAWDSVADMVGIAAGLVSLGVGHVVTLPVSVGSGTVRVAHGVMPVPVPAVLRLLTRSGLPWRQLPEGVARFLASAEPGHTHSGIAGQQHPHGHAHEPEHAPEAPVASLHEVGELASPTGVAVLAALAAPASWTSARQVAATGVGAGSKDFAGWPNVVQVSLLDDAAEILTSSRVEAMPRPDGTIESLRVLETNLDDVDPRVWPSVIEALVKAGARDVWLTAALGKKGRPMHVLSVLVDPLGADPGDFVSLIVETTGTLGVREYAVARHALGRGWFAVALPEPLHGQVSVKYGFRAGRIVHASAEYADCARLAAELGVPVTRILEAARGAAESAGLVPGAAVPEADRA